LLVLDRYEIGERQTSACGIPTGWLEALDLEGSLRQTFDELVVHTPWTTARWQLPWTFSTFDFANYARSCGIRYPTDAEFETATVTGSRRAHRPYRPRGLDRPTDRRRARLETRALQ